VWVTASILRDYFVERQVDVKYAMRELAGHGVAKYDGRPMTKRIGAGALFGMEASGVRSYCFDAAVLGMDVDVFTGMPDGPEDPRT